MPWQFGLNYGRAQHTFVSLVADQDKYLTPVPCEQHQEVIFIFPLPDETRRDEVNSFGEDQLVATKKGVMDRFENVKQTCNIIHAGT